MGKIADASGVKVGDQEALARHVEAGEGDLIYFALHMLGIVLHPGQVRAWEFQLKYCPVTFFLCGNRAGKTVYIACKHIWKHFYKKMGPGQTVDERQWEFITYATFNLAPLSELTIIMYNTILDICRGNFVITMPGEPFRTNESKIAWFVDFPGNNNPQRAPKTGPYYIIFAYGTEFRAFTMGGTHGDSVQGRSFHYGSYDEFGRSKDPDGEFNDIIPRLGQYSGELDVITTPDMENIIASEFLLRRLEEATKHPDEYRFFSWSAEDNVYLSDQAKKTMVAGMTDEMRSQILRGEIMRAAPRYFPRSSVDKMFVEGLRYLDFLNRIPDKNRRYSGGLDTAGLGKDGWAFYIVDVTEKPFKIVHKYVKYGGTPAENRQITRDIVQNMYDFVGRNAFQWRMDYTSEGGTIIFDDLRDLEPIPTRFGFEPGSGKNQKHALTDNLRRVVYDDFIQSPPDKQLFDQIAYYRGPKDDKKQKTDCVMALALAVLDDYERAINNDSSSAMVFDL